MKDDIHATVNALRCFYDWIGPDVSPSVTIDRLACTWEATNLHQIDRLGLTLMEAREYVNEGAPLPELTCHVCLVMLDMVLERADHG